MFDLCPSKSFSNLKAKKEKRKWIEIKLKLIELKQMNKFSTDVAQKSECWMPRSENNSKQFWKTYKPERVANWDFKDKNRQ